MEFSIFGRILKKFCVRCARTIPRLEHYAPKRYWKGFGWFQAPEECNFPPKPPPEKYGGHPVGTLQKVQRRGRFEGWKGRLPKSGGNEEWGSDIFLTLGLWSAVLHTCSTQNRDIQIGILPGTRLTRIRLNPRWLCFYLLRFWHNERGKYIYVVSTGRDCVSSLQKMLGKWVALPVCYTVGPMSL